MAFKGWPAEALEFYDGLEADNSKSYWLANKDLYERIVKGPMDELLAELAPEFGPGKVFRPYRDVRFSADKTPYKTNLAASVGDSGYIQLTRDGIAAGSGMWMMAPDQLDRYRRAVAADRTGVELEKVVAVAAEQGIEITGHGSLKTAPKGYARDHARIDLLRHKGLVAWRDWPVAPWLGTAKAKTRVEDFLRAAAPLRDWLDANVGASTMLEPARR